MLMKPKQFYLAPLIMILIALSFPLQVMILYGHQWTETQAIFSKMTSLNWVIAISFMMAAYFYYQASRGILFFAPVLLALVAFNNYIVGSFGADFSLQQTTLATLFSASLFVPLALPSSQIILKDPKRRWWRASKRYSKKVGATLNPYVGEMVEGETFDVSKTGAFVCVEELDNLPKIGDTVRVSLKVNSMRRIRCEAVVVRIAEPQGRYPQGMGIRFTEMSKTNEKCFEKFLSSNEVSH